MIHRLPFIAAMILQTGALAANAEEMAFDCVIDPSRTVLVSSAVTGLLSEVLVERGDKVVAGEPLARLASGEEQATVALLEARAGSVAQIESQQGQLDLSQSRYDRVKALFDREVATADQMREAEAELTASKSLLELAELNRVLSERELDRARSALSEREILSPIDGIVASREKNVGEFLDQSSHILTLVRLDPLYVEAFLPVDLYGVLALGQTLAVEPAAPIGGRYEATVSVVDQVFDAASATFGVRLSLPNPDQKLPGGQRCKLLVVTPG